VSKNSRKQCDERRLQAIETIKATLQREPTVLFAFLHGSFLSGPVFRDIDIGVFLTPGESFSDLDIELDLSHKVEAVLGYAFPAEVKPINHAPLAFCYSVVRGRLLFSKNESVLVDFMTRVAREYLDFAPLRHRYLKEAMLT